MVSFLCLMGIDGTADRLVRIKQYVNLYLDLDTDEIFYGSNRLFRVESGHMEETPCLDWANEHGASFARTRQNLELWQSVISQVSDDVYRLKRKTCTARLYF